MPQAIERPPLLPSCCLTVAQTEAETAHPNSPTHRKPKAGDTRKRRQDAGIVRPASVFAVVPAGAVAFMGFRRSGVQIPTARPVPGQKRGRDLSPPRFLSGEAYLTGSGAATGSENVATSPIRQT